MVYEKKNRWRKRTGLLAALLAASLAAGSFSGIAAEAGEEKTVGELSVDIRKRVEWTDETNGDARITLEYASNSGAIRGTRDMDVVLIHDKSGSMDMDYGFHINLEYQGLTEEGADWVYQPIRNDWGYSESAASNARNTDYCTELWIDGSYDTHIGEYRYNATCQLDGHYYFLTEYDTFSDQEAGFFVPGRLIYNAFYTDLHHYIRLSGREEAVAYLNEGRRVIRTANYYDDDGNKVQLEGESAYFLDVSRLYSVPGAAGKMLVIGDTGCEAECRLPKSQEFMKRLTELVYSCNKENEIAYVPFWCDVPEDADGDGTGSWNILSSVGTSPDSAVVEDRRAGDITEREGTYSLDFCGADRKEELLSQIDNSFTYNGTNWGAGFRKALEYLQKKRESEETIRPALIIFLTDGYPQGFRGKPEDIQNTVLGAAAELNELKAMEQVTIYACGTGINDSDTTGLAERLVQADSGGTPAYARLTTDFDTLYETISERLTDQYVTEINAEDLIYTDALSDAFSLREDASMENEGSFRFLDTACEEQEAGAPAEVYAAFKEGAKLVYVRDTKTIYWYPGRVTEGSFGDEGHSVTFPVSFSEYDTATDAQEISYISNEVQKATYYSSQNTEVLEEVSMDSPALLFSRQSLCPLTITLTLVNGMAEERMKCDFLITNTEKAEGDTASEQDLVRSITIPAGSVEGSLQIPDMTEGTWYVYRLDEEGKVRKDTEKTAEITREEIISTKAVSESVPASAVTTEAAPLENRSNVLTLTTKGAELSFEEELPQTGDLTVRKSIYADEIWWEHGEPTFVITVEGRGVDGKNYCFAHTFRFTKEAAEQEEENGIISLDWVLSDIPLSESYEVKEIVDSGYCVEKIQGNGQNVTLPSGGETCAYVDLTNRRKGTKVTIFNKKNNYFGDKHVTSVFNEIRWK